MTIPVSAPRFPTHGLPLLLVLPLLLAMAILLPGSPTGPPGAGPLSAVAAALAQQTDDTDPWSEVDRLIAEDKMQEALERVSAIRDAAREADDARTLARALLSQTELETALHGYETAVRGLADQAWPESPVYRSAIELYFGQTLVHYLQAYSWEIRQREPTGSADAGDALDLDRMTHEELLTRAHASFFDVWRERQEWGDADASEQTIDFVGFLVENTYPERIRGTLRDRLSYLWADLLANTANWTVQQSNEVWKLDARLLVDADSALRDVDFLDESVHPLVELAAVLGDLERWHARAGRPEAAFEARLERLRRLVQGFDSAPASAQLVLRELERSVRDFDRQLPWWSMGMARLAEVTRSDTTRTDAELAAHRIAAEGAQAHPDSVGGQTCRAILQAIERPEVQLAGMASDAPRKRSIEVTYKNIEALHFRAYTVDLVRQIQRSRDYQLLADARLIETLFADETPAHTWSETLPATTDFRQHRAFVTPPLERPGLYVIVASLEPDFGEGAWKVGLPFLVTDLVMLTRTVPAQSGGQFHQREITVRSGASGRVMSGVTVDLYRFDYQRGHTRVAGEITDGDGIVRFAVPSDGAGRPGRNQYFALALLRDDAALDPNYYGFARRHEPESRNAALLYTDRSVYRPGQTLYFKAVVYRGDDREGRFAVRENAPIDVALLDTNGEEVTRASLRTNGFGSASGEVQIPAGRLLGTWRLQVSTRNGRQIGNTFVQVEEYKRPTFEVTLDAPQEELRLNRDAELGGTVRYYFGLPVISGRVQWRVRRDPIYPDWWYWYGRPTTGSQQIAIGESTLDEEGRFSFSFVAEAEEPVDEAGRALRYRYAVAVDVTDEGGETRSAERSFNLGFVSVQARVSSATAFFDDSRAAQLEVMRTDLDGEPRAGSGSYRLVELEQPPTTLLPAEQPLLGPTAGFETPGDRLRPRHAPQYDVAQVLRGWRDGRTLRSGDLTHDEAGTAVLELGRLRPGAYRVHYETEDAFGVAAQTQHELVVARRGETRLELPAILLAERSSVAVGETARLLVHSGLAEQELLVELFRDGERTETRRFESGQGLQLIEIPVTEELRGGFGVALTAVRDHQLMRSQASVFVPWHDRELRTTFSTFRDRLRPGQHETWRVSVVGHDEQALERGSVELLAYMYDRSLDLFAPHRPPSITALYPHRASPGWMSSSLGVFQPVWYGGNLPRPPAGPALAPDRLRFASGYGIGGPGARRYRQDIRMQASARMVAAAPGNQELITVTSEAPLLDESAVSAGVAAEAGGLQALGYVSADEPAPTPAAVGEIRSDFSETAFWEPHLLLDADGGVSFEFTVPDSVTEWNVWLHALTTDLRGGSSTQRARTVKDLLVRPYLPRFLREADRAEIPVVVNNAGEEVLAGELVLDIVDPVTEESLLAEFGLDRSATRRDFRVEPGAGTELVFPITTPARVGTVAFRVVATAGDLSDGELRPLPVLPGRVHLTQSRFVTLTDEDRREIHFAELLANDDPTRIDDQMVVTLDGQLFYSVLSALPYLIDYPYECTEQTLNRFLSTGILSSLFDRYPAVRRMADTFAARETRFESFDAPSPDRKMLLEETPWLQQSRGGAASEANLVKVLDPRVAAAQRRSSLAELEAAQTAIGGFPWFPGGPPSPYMTLYVLDGLSRALEFEVELPPDRVQPMARRGWAYLQRHWIDELASRLVDGGCCWELVTYLNYVLSSYEATAGGLDAWTGGVFSAEDRARMLDFSFEHWRSHSPRLKALLALTLERSGRSSDARLVLDSIMDSARTERDLGTYWAREDRSWLWYNDTIESHAFILRALSELDPDDDRRPGLVQWLMLNKKLNHWKSTRATAEVVYSLAHYLEQEGTLEQNEAATVTVGDRVVEFTWSADSYSGDSERVVVPGEEVGPATATVSVAKSTPGLLFASATWHFSTERTPSEAQGDFLSVKRSFYRRVPSADGFELEPLSEGARIGVGDMVEVQLVLEARHAAEYVHLRDPRGAGFEPTALRSGYEWDLGIVWYEEVRDSGSNFFFERLPAGEYTFRHRLRATTAGTFKVAPATVQSMYAPEFTAYSAGAQLTIAP